MEYIEISKANFPEILKIYKEGINTGLATFETKMPDWVSWDNSHFNFGRIVAIKDSEVLGWASLSPVSSRCVYGGVAEVSIYVAERARGEGLGERLLKNLIKISEENNIWTLQAGIMRANTASISVHLACGFREIGFREKIGKLKGVWLDNIILERRSTIVGI